MRLSDVLVEPAGEGGRSGGKGVDARISQRRFVGTAEILELFLQGYEEPVRARIRAGVLPEAVRYVRVRVNDGAALLFPHG